MKRFILGVAAALVLSAGQAAADGLPSKGTVRAPAAEAGPNWNGFYLGLGIGAGAVVHDLTAAKDRAECVDYSYAKGKKSKGKKVCEEYEYYTDTFNFDGIGGEGIFGTVTIGYDRVIRPGWVAGVFADYDFSNISTDVSFNGEGASLDHNYSWAVGGRLGFLANPSTLLYGTAGYTQAEFDIFGLTSETFHGYFVGGGVETFLRPDWTLKLEYRFTQFDGESFGNEYSSVELEPSMHTARLVLSYKLGHRD